MAGGAHLDGHSVQAIHLDLPEEGRREEPAQIAYMEHGDTQQAPHQLQALLAGQLSLLSGLQRSLHCVCAENPPALTVLNTRNLCTLV